jgi:predicted dehydrogenase
MKFLIAGLGSVGRRHMRNLILLGEKDIVLLRTRKATLPDDELTGYPVETDINEAIKKHKPDAVIVSNPTAFHLDVAIPAAQAGCTILLEKPISGSMQRIDELSFAVKKNNAKVLVAFQFRFHPSLIKAKELIANGEIGRIISANVHFGEYLPAWHPWEDYRISYAARAELGGGVVATQCHSLDYLPWLLGEKIESVFAYTAKLSDLEIDVEDTAKIALRFENGALGSLHLDFNQQPPEHHFTIVGTKGTIKWNLADGGLRIYQPEKKDWVAYPLPASWERNVMFVEQTKHFVDIVKGNVHPSCTLDDGIQLQKLVEAVHQSNKIGSVILFE